MAEQDQKIATAETEHRAFVRNTLNTLVSDVSDMKTSVTKIETVFEHDHPRDIAKDVANLELKVNNNANANNALSAKVMSIYTSISAGMAAAVGYIAKHWN